MRLSWVRIPPSANVKNSKMHKKTKGSIAEMAVSLHLMEMGWNILFPFDENNRYDLVIEKEGKFARIQVKYVTPKNGVLNVNCRSSNNWSVLKYTAKEIDLIAAYDSINKSIYFIPVRNVNNSVFKIRINQAKNNQKIGIHPAKDFLKINIL